MRALRAIGYALCAALLVLSMLLAVEEARAAERCEPSTYGGTGSPLVTSDAVGDPHPDGNWGAWHCPDPFRVVTFIYARRHDHQLRLPSLEGMTPAQAFAAVLDANVTLPLSDPSLAGLRTAAQAYMAAHAPPAPRWLVAKNGTSTTRPVYLRNADGTRGKEVSGVRATVGEPCSCADPARRVGDGTSTTYCDAGKAEQLVVTVCSRAAP